MNTNHTYQRETVDGLLVEIMPLLMRHYEEIAWRKEQIKFDPDLDRYRKLEAADFLRIYTARTDGILVGYAVFIISMHLHYKANKVATNDIFYVEPSMRGAMVGRRLIGHVERELKAEGVEVISLHIKTAHNWQKLAEHWGYEQNEVNMKKWIGE